MQGPQIDGPVGGAEEPAAEDVKAAPPSRRGWMVLALLLGLGAAGAAWWWVTPRGEAVQPPVAVPDAPTADAAVTATPPSLAEGDALLAQAVGASNATRLRGLLAREGMIGILTAAVNMVAEGSTPAPMLSFITLPGRFSVESDRVKPAPAPRGQAARRKKGHAAPPLPPDGPVFMSPASYARYDDVTQLVTSLDPAVAARQYQRLRPYFDTAFQVIARPGVRFEDVLKAAIRRLLSVKLLEGRVELERKVLVYVYKDPALEALSPAEKQLLRMGPRNGKVIQDYLRRFSDAAGLKE